MHSVVEMCLNVVFSGHGGNRLQGNWYTHSGVLGYFVHSVIDYDK